MTKNIAFGISLALLSLGLAGCKPHHASRHPAISGYFQTEFQDESQFIVETIVSDLAEQIYFAKFNHLPDKSDFYVSANEAPDSTFSTPTYNVEVDLDSRIQNFETKLNISGPIWSPEVYDDLTAQLSQRVGLPAGDSGNLTDTGLLAKLADGTAETIERENQDLSGALADDFPDGTLHEKAALLLGAFALREHSGHFYEIRTPLCRMTAHLAMARYLEGKSLSPLNGGIAEAMLYTLMNNEAEALDQLRGIKTNDPAVASWVRALQAHNTGDYRPLDKLDGLSQVECIHWFHALDKSANTDIAWSKLSDVQKQIPDFCRIANQGGYSVQLGHELLALSLQLEFKEIASIYQLSQRKQLGSNELIQALNELPDRCFSPGPDGKTGVHVISWGLWAGFFQRQLCHAVVNNFDCMENKWGVPEDAASFSARCDEMLGGLRLYPFVRRYDCVDLNSYHKSVEDGLKVTVATPQLVPVECWNHICDPYGGERYLPNPNPHVNEWHAHNPPPGTAYDPGPRMYHPSLVNRADSGALLENLHALAPYDSHIAYFILSRNGGKDPSYDEASRLLEPVLAYANYAMITVADTPEVRSDPDRYAYLLSEAAAVNPEDYFTLGHYFEELHLDDKAAASYEKGNVLCPDAVLAAAYADWLIQYYLRKGETEKARVVADNAGDAYSFSGLEAKADFLETTGDPSGAFEWYAKIEERYNDAGPLVSFCIRYKGKTQDTRFDAELQKRIATLFPRGIQRVTLDSFHSAPTDGGVVFKEESDLLRAAGLHRGDVVVAIDGIRVYDIYQYDYERDLYPRPELDLIVWFPGEQVYHEINCSPPKHLFGVRIDTYKP